MLFFADFHTWTLNSFSQFSYIFTLSYILFIDWSLISFPISCQETDSRGEGGGASAGQSSHPAAAAVRPPEVP